MRYGLLAVLVAFACSLFAPAAPAAEPVGKEMWLFWQNNLANEKSVEDLLQLIDRAGKLGFTHLLISDTRSNHLADLWHDEPQRYPKNVQKVKDACAKAGMKPVPAVFDVGYSNGSLWMDPNWAEGSPVKDAPFVVKNGQAEPAGEPVVLKEKPGLVDETVKYESGAATIGPHQGNARVNWQITLPKRRAYHVSLKIKTQDYSGARLEVKPIADGFGILQYHTLAIKPTQDWTEHHVVFNTLDNEKITFYVGIWGNTKGTLQWKDLKVEEAGLVNLLRRPGCPLEVKLVKDGAAETLKEGEDYEPVKNPLTGTKPWKGAYTVWHEAPVIKIKNAAKVPDGSKLLVSWYHAQITVEGQVGMCPSEPAVNEHLADTARRIKALWGAETYFMEHDEVRHMNHCKACTDRKLTTGQILAENVAYCSKLLEGSRRVVWSDAFDPHHNAIKNYWLAGDKTGSWEGLPKDVTPMLWYHGSREKSAEFFRKRGHELMMSIHYDNDDPQRIKDWFDVAKKVGGVRGVMYTTWAGSYKNVESFARNVKVQRDGQ